MRAPSASLEANEWIQGANKPPRIMAFSAGGILAHDLFNQFGVKDFADGEVLLHHQPSASVSSFPIHRCIMAARSEPLRQYFQKLEDEKRTPVLDLSVRASDLVFISSQLSSTIYNQCVFLL